MKNEKTKLKTRIRRTKIKRSGENGKYRYFIEGTDGRFSEPQERIWVVAMFALWQKNKRVHSKITDGRPITS